MTLVTMGGGGDRGGVGVRDGGSKKQVQSGGLALQGLASSLDAPTLEKPKLL